MTTEVVCFALTAAGLVIALLQTVRRRLLSATRWTAAALLPAGVYLAGLVPTVRRVGRALRDWAQSLVLDPRVWTGLGLLALSLLLFAGARIAARRRVRTASRAVAAPPTAPPASPRTLATRPSPAPGASAAPRKTGTDDLGDFSEIEEILRRRGL